MADLRLDPGLERSALIDRKSSGLPKERPERTATEVPVGDAHDRGHRQGSKRC
jgi:hypothetical protein